MVAGASGPTASPARRVASSGNACEACLTSTEPVKTPTLEIRIGLVLYGGVALAIYIYGVVLEFWRLVVASRGRPNDAVAYTGLLEQAKVRVSLDIVSGASAGGINGVLLGKALATGAPLDAVRNLWLDRGDLGGLMRSTSERKPRSLLRSDVFEQALRTGLADLDAKAQGGSLERAIDVFVAGTRLQGYVRRFVDDLGQVLQVRHYRKAFHLKHREPRETATGETIGYERLDFAAERNESLIQVARATSAFPFAFEPRLIQRNQRTEHLFERSEPDAEYFSDGGILHNKPFTETIDAIFTRPAERPVRRWLVSVEPTPEKHDLTVPPREPEVVEVVAGALSGIPRYESIAADLERVADYRTQVERTVRLLEEIEEVLASPAFLQALDSTNDEFEAFLSSQLLYAGYNSLRRGLAIAALTDALLDAAGLDEAARPKVREGIRAYADAPQGNPRGLDGRDPSVEIRRVYYLIDALDRRTRNVTAEQQAPFIEPRERLWSQFDAIRRLMWEVFAGPARVPELSALANAPEAGVQVATQAVMEKVQNDLEAGLDAIRTTVQEACATIDAALPVAAADAPPPPSFTKIFQRYRLWDMFHASIEALTGRQSRDVIEFARVSPETATSTGVDSYKKLAGDELGHFGGFLKRDWRKNDILWGRLDGAEIILKLLAQEVPGFTDAQLTAAIEAAHREILAGEKHSAAKAKDYRASLDKRAIGQETVADVPAEERARLLTNGAAVARNIMRGLGESPAISGVARKIYAFAGRVLGVVLALVRWPVLAIWARDPALAWVGTLVMLFMLLWAIATAVLLVLGVIGISLQLGLLMAGALAAFLIWVFLVQGGLSRLALIGPPMFASVALALTALKWDFLHDLGWSAVEDSDVPWPSALALGDYGWVQAGNFVLLGVTTLALAAAVRRTVKPRKLGAAVIAVLGLALLAAAVRSDRGFGDPETWHGYVHVYALLAVVVAAVIAPFALGWDLRGVAESGRSSAVSFVVGVAALVAILVSDRGEPIAFYVFLAIILLWLMFVAWRTRTTAART